MALKHYVMAALVLGGGVWLSVTGLRRVAAERQEVASQYSLSAQQMTVYDKCISAMEHRRLRAGGSEQQFCGCLTQRGLSGLTQDESDAILGWIKKDPPEPAMVTDRQGRALEAAISCSEDTRGTWASVEAVRSWCAEKATRRGLPQCKIDLK
jgi:hypothetical protein